VSAQRALLATLRGTRQDGAAGRWVGSLPGEDLAKMPTAAQAHVRIVKTALVHAG
jgi:hypothetical protein